MTKQRKQISLILLSNLYSIHMIVNNFSVNGYINLRFYLASQAYKSCRVLELEERRGNRINHKSKLDNLAEEEESLFRGPTHQSSPKGNQSLMSQENKSRLRCPKIYCCHVNLIASYALRDI